MTNVSCTRCGTINLLAAEICQQCGAELHYMMPARDTSTDVNSAEEYAEEPAGRHEEFSFTPEIGPFTGIGSVLSPTITIFKDNFWLIFKLSFMVFAPFEVFKAISIGNIKPTPQAAIAGGFLWVFCHAIVTPALVYSLVQVMRTGTAPTLNDAYRFGLGKIGKLVPTALLAWILELLGFICLIIPGLILSVAFQLIYPMVALENLSPVEILKRSYNLTKGHRWNIFWSGIVIGLLVGVVSMPVSFAVAIFSFPGSFSWGVQAAVQAVGSLITDVLSEATLVLSLVIYFSILKSNGLNTNDPQSQGMPFPRSPLPPPPPVFNEPL